MTSYSKMLRNRKFSLVPRNQNSNCPKGYQAPLARVLHRSLAGESGNAVADLTCSHSLQVVSQTLVRHCCCACALLQGCWTHSFRLVAALIAGSDTAKGRAWNSPSRSSPSSAGCARASAPLEKPGGDCLHHFFIASSFYLRHEFPSPPSNQAGRIICILQARFFLCFPSALQHPA